MLPTGPAQSRSSGSGPGEELRRGWLDRKRPRVGPGLLYTVGHPPHSCGHPASGTAGLFSAAATVTRIWVTFKLCSGRRPVGGPCAARAMAAFPGVRGLFPPGDVSLTLQAWVKALRFHQWQGTWCTGGRAGHTPGFSTQAAAGFHFPLQQCVCVSPSPSAYPGSISHQ